MDRPNQRNPERFRRAEDAQLASSEGALLADAAMALLGCRDVDSAYRVICESIARLCPGAVVIANEVTPEGDAVVTRWVAGLKGPLLARASKLVGYKFIGKRSAIVASERDAMLAGTLSKVSRGFVDFASSEVTASVASSLAVMLGIHDVYTIGISDGSRTLGNVHLFMLSPDAAPQTPLIEAFAHHCFSALEGIMRSADSAATAARHEAILQTTLDGFWIVDDDGHFLKVNDAYCRMSGYSEKELLNMRIADVEAVEASEETLARIRDIHKKGALRFESRHRRKDGSCFDVEVSTQHLLDSGTGIAAFLRDITERKRSERELRESEERLSALFQRAPLGYQSLDENGCFIEVNDAWLELLGYSREEVMGAWFGDFLAPEFTEAFRERFPLFKSLGAIHSEFQMVRKDGVHRTIAFEGRIGHNPDGTFRQTHCILSDITERTQFAKALHQSEERLRRAVLEAPFPIMIHADDGEVLQVNNEWQRVTGYAPSDIPTIGDWTEKAYGTRAEMVQEDIDALYGMTGSRDEGEYVIRTSSGDTRTWYFKSAALGAVDGGRRAVISTAVDVTDRNRTGEELVRQRDKIARTLTSVIDIARDIVEERDPYTAGHQRRVSEIAVRVARGVGMSEADVEDVRLAALIHDVGKVVVPTEILSKPGAISPLEYELLKAHAEAGHRILRAAHLDEPLPELVYQHHERCDGSGYPRGLDADTILPGAKIIAVADVVEAMVSHRPYRPGLGVEAALAGIEHGAGSLYDPDAARACVSLFREDGFELT